MSARVARIPGLLSVVLIAAVLIMHVWTGPSGEHLGMPVGSATMSASSASLTSNGTALNTPGQPSEVTVGPTQARTLSAPARMPTMAMAGMCAAILLLFVRLSLPRRVRLQIRPLSRAGRLPRPRPESLGPPPDLNLRLCVLRT